MTLDAAGNDRGVLQACYGGYQYSRRVGGANYGAWLLCRACLTLIACGRTADAAGALHAAQRVRLSGIFEVYAQLAVAGLATLSGDFEAGRTAIERCRRVAPDPLPWAWRYCAAAAELELWARRPGTGLRGAAEGLAAVARTDYRRHAGTLAWMALRATAGRGELARARQDTAATSQACADASQLRRTWSTAGWLTAEPPDRARALHALLDAEHARAADYSDPQQSGPRDPLLACLPPAAPGRLCGMAPGRSPARAACPPAYRGLLPALQLLRRPRYRRDTIAARG